MYIPSSNRIDDIRKAFEFIENYGFATVVTQKDGVPWASHLPVLLDSKCGARGALISHMARANEQWRHFDQTKEVLCIFFGPHSYISPSWYMSKIPVPTWNYATTHVYGYPTVVEDAESVRAIVEDTTRKYEKEMKQPWKMELPEETVSSLLKAIVGFRIEITRIEAKFKLGQNRSKEDQESMLRFLEGSPSPDSLGLATFIKSQK